MNSTPIKRQFLRMGVRMEVQPPAPPRSRWNEEEQRYTLDVQRDERGEHFLLGVPRGQEESLEAQVLQARPAQKHLLLMIRRNRESRVDRYLCGHDEREWFVAAVPGAVSTVEAAMESLKPRAVRIAQVREHLRRKEFQRRRNRAFRRQGEWFFLPFDGRFTVSDWLILNREPIARSGGKPHMVEELVRTGGEIRYFCSDRPNGLSVQAYRRLLKQRPKAKNWGWHTQRINPAVLARGAVRHPDHKTIILDDWHWVLMNTEHESPGAPNVVFID